MPLTGILASKKIENVPPHPDFPSKVKPEGLVCDSAKECRGCPLSASHKTYERARLTQPLAPEHRMNTTLLRLLQWYVHRIANDVMPMMGSQDGFLFNAAVAYNFCLSIRFEIISASGRNITLKTTDGSDPRDLVLYSYRTNAEAFVSQHKVTSEIRGRIQPGDKLRFDWPSVLEKKCKPTVVRIVGCDPDARTVTLELDKSAEGYDWISDATLPELPAKWYCTILRYTELEKWQPVIDWDNFPAVRRRITLTVDQINAADASGKVRLTDAAGADTCIADYYEAPPEYYDETTFQVWGWKDNEWHNLTGQCLSRYQVETFNTSPPTYRTTVYLGDRLWPTEEHPEGQPAFDLRTEYSSFRIVYYARATAAQIAGGRALAVGQHRCKWSRIDHSGSAGNYAMPNGVGVSGGVHHECLKRRYRVETKVYDTDPESPTFGDQIGITYEYRQPSGIENYPEDGRCMQCNSCDMYEPMMSDSSVDVENAPFSGWFTWGRWYRQITAGADIFYHNPMPGIASHRAWTVGRRNNPSLRSIHGDLPLTSDVGMHELYVWPTWGLIGKTETYTEQQIINEGTPNERTLTHTRLRYARRGAHWNLVGGFDGIEFDNPSTYPSPGHLPEEVSGYTDKHDLVNYTQTIPDGLPMANPYYSLRLYDDRSGYMNRLDSGEIIGRGYHQYSHIVPQNEALYVPKVDLEKTGETQDFGDFEFRVLTVPETRQGKTIGAVLTVKPMTSDLKDPHSPVSGTIHSITPLGDDRFQIELENGPHYHSVMEGSGLSRYDRVFTWRAGGSFVRLPKFCYPNSYYETKKAVGGQADLCMPGDSVTIDYDLNGIDLSEVPFFVESALACAGSEDPSWGSEHIIRRFVAPGYWEVDPGFMLIETDELLGDIHDSIRTPSTVTPGAHPSGSTQLWIVPAVPLSNGCKLRNRRTGEQVSVSNWSMFVEGAPHFGGLVDLSAPTAQATEAGDEWEWLTVTDASSPFAPLTEKVGPNGSRPSLAANEYWVDRDNNRIYFGPGTAATYPDVSIQYTAAQKGLSSSDVRIDSFEVPEYGYMSLGVTFSQVDGKPVVCRYADGQTLTKVSDNPAEGEFSLHNVDGAVWIKTSLADAGKALVIDWDLETELSDPGPVSVVTNYGDWARRRDVITVVDESGKLAAAMATLAGAPITCWWNRGAVWYPDPNQKLEVAQYQTDTFVTAPTEELIMEHGTGRIYITTVLLEQWQSTYGRFVCFRL